MTVLQGVLAVLVSTSLLVSHPSGTRPADQAQFRIPANIATALWGAAERSYNNDLEELYCLLGREVDGHDVVFGAMKPRQRAWVTRFGGVIISWHVNHDLCPPGTVADVHTHPGNGENWTPSRQDRKTWMLPHVTYRTHLILFVRPNRQVAFKVYRRENGGIVPVPDENSHVY